MSPTPPPEPAKSCAESQPETYTCPPESNKSLGPLSLKILPSLFRLYNLEAGPKDYEIYGQDATFEDPLMKAKGVNQIKSAFYSMQKLFAEAGIKEYSVIEESSSTGTGQILVDNVQHYKVAGRTFDVVSRIDLTVENGLVTSHKDLWDKKPLPSGFVGAVAQACRSANMIITHTLMGFGRDPKPKS